MQITKKCRLAPITQLINGRAKIQNGDCSPDPPCMPPASLALREGADDWIGMLRSEVQLLGTSRASSFCCGLACRSVHVW